MPNKISFFISFFKILFSLSLFILSLCKNMLAELVDQAQSIDTVYLDVS
jgi:hypothetical protein